jgi:mono/diheme cytochrome c family protein
MKTARWLLAAAVVSPLVACRTEQTLVEPDPHLERMLRQPKRLAYDEDPLLRGGMAMQAPPPGAMPVDAVVDDPVRQTGIREGRWAEHVPVPIDRPAIERGRAHFDAFCAPCHGVVGDATSVVAEKMGLRGPRDLQDPAVRDYAPGRIFDAVHRGYGMMPSYAAQLSVDDAWGVVAYVRALQLSRHAQVAQLPPAMRARLLAEAP